MTELTFLNDTLNIADAPAGFVFRRYRGESDLPLMVELINTIARADQHDFVQTLDDLRNQYTHLMNCDMERDFVMVETVDGQTVAYARLWWEIDDEGLLRFPIVLNLHPDFRQPPDVGLAVLRWAEARAHEIGAAHPHTGPRVLQTWVQNIELERDRIAALEAANYTAVRWGYLMTRDLAAPIEARALPDGLEVRPVTTAHYRKIWEALDEAFRDHWGHRPGTEADYQQFINEPSLDSSLWQVAFADDEIAGMVLTFIPREENQILGLKRGWTDPICVRRPWRKLGLAKALLLRSLRLLKAQGMTEAALGVDSQNPNGALQLYESCGFKPMKRGTTYRKNL